LWTEKEGLNRGVGRQLPAPLEKRKQIVSRGDIDPWRTFHGEFRFDSEWPGERPHKERRIVESELRSDSRVGTHPIRLSARSYGCTKKALGSQDSGAVIDATRRGKKTSLSTTHPAQSGDRLHPAFVGRNAKKGR